MPPRKVLASVAGLVALVGAAVGVSLRLAASSTPPITGTLVDQIVPDVHLVDQHGHALSLADEQGRVVVIYPFLTACHEICPMTTGAFVRMSEAIRRAGLSSRVALWEVSVDPERDTPDRLAAYGALVSADWELVTGTSSALGAFWRFFGVYSQRTDIPSPAPLDWYTHEPDTYDITHTPALIFIDARGRERIVLVGAADVGGVLSPVLSSMLDSSGRANLAHPDAPWTVQEALNDIGALIGRHIPAY